MTDIINKKTTIAELYRWDLIGTRAFNCCRNTKLFTVEDIYLYHFRHSSFLDIHACGKKANAELVRICALYHATSPLEAESIIPQLDSTKDSSEDSKKADTFPWETNTYLDSILKDSFAHLRAGLSVRGRHLCDETYATYKDCIPHLGMSLYSYQKLFATKRKTAKELFAFLQAFSSTLNEALLKSEEDLKYQQLEEAFPFLLKPELEFVKEKENELGHLPMFYILEHFLSLSSDRSSLVFSMYYGINGGQALTLEELAKMNGCSRERIRQLVHGFKLPSYLKSNRGIWDYYKHIPPFLFEGCDDYNTIVQEESINPSYISFCGLVIASLSYVPIRFNNDVFLVPNKCEKTARKLLVQIRSLFKEKYSKDTAFSIKDLFHPASETTFQICKIVIKELYDTPVSEEGTFVIKQGYISIEEELINVLEIFGEPMSLEDLFVLFKDKYPDHKFVEARSIYNHIAKSDSIIAIGKTGRYGLKKWNLFHGSIRDYVYEFLEQHETPQPDSVLIPAVLEVFPNTNKKSILSSLKSDEKCRFIRFQDSYTGLSSRSYSSELRLIPTRKSIPFEERLEDLRRFIIKHKRFPFTHGGDEELSLNRWIGNHTREGAGYYYNKEQARRILGVLSEFASYPHNETEYVFQQMCSDYRYFINNVYRLPELDSIDDKEQELAAWFNRSLLKYNSFKDNRKLYFQELLGFLSDFGFYI